MDNKMFCYQCEQTAGCGGCTGAAGVCGKTADVAKLQDELTGALVALARGIHEAPEVGTDTWRMMIEGLFATVTNVDFNEKTLRKRIAQVHKETERLCGQGDDYSMENVWNAQEDIRSLKSLILFGVRGMAAYTHHSLVLGYTDEEVNRQLVRLQQQSQRRTPVFDRPSQNGDELVLDYAGFADGKQFAGGTAEKQTLVLGSNTFIPGFEAQLLGKNPGDDVTVHVTFPTAYHAPELAGKDAEFRCHIHEIRTVAPYALDDVFAKEVGQCETMAEMRENMRKSLENYYAERAELELRDRLLRQAADTMDDFTPNPAEISKAVEEQLDTMSAQLAQNNLTLDDYCKFSNSTLEQLREDARPGAEEAVRIKALVRRVAQAEELHAHEEDVAQALSEICRANHMTMEELQPYYDDTFAAAVEYSILLAKVTKRIRESAILEQ